MRQFPVVSALVVIEGALQGAIEALDIIEKAWQEAGTAEKVSGTLRLVSAAKKGVQAGLQGVQAVRRGDLN